MLHVVGHEHIAWLLRTGEVDVGSDAKQIGCHDRQVAPPGVAIGEVIHAAGLLQGSEGGGRDIIDVHKLAAAGLRVCPVASKRRDDRRPDAPIQERIDAIHRGWSNGRKWLATLGVASPEVGLDRRLGGAVFRTGTRWMICIEASIPAIEDRMEHRHRTHVDKRSASRRVKHGDTSFDVGFHVTSKVATPHSIPIETVVNDGVSAIEQ